MGRQADLDRLYALFGRIEERLGGIRRLKNCDGYMDWPDRGVYFFFSPEETRSSDDHPRLTRIGTHAVSGGSQTSLWNRLRNHRGATRGTYEGGGNHRGSVFRKRVGEAMIERDGLHDEYPEWATGNTAGRGLRTSELDMERRVSDYLRNLPFLWIGIDDEPGPDSLRAYVEANAIGLASNYGRTSIDPRSSDWLGTHSPVEEIRESDLWNIEHVEEEYDPNFLDVLEEHLGVTGPKRDGGSFEAAWEEIVRFADTNRYVSTLSRGNRNEIRSADEAIEVRNMDTGEWRAIDRADFRYAHGILIDRGELSLDDIEPELAGRKSMTVAILANALDLEYDGRPLTLYARE